MGDAWIPESTRHGIKIEHSPGESAGAFTTGGWKTLWHTTEGRDLDTMVNVLQNKRAAPHLVVCFRTKRVVQMVGFDAAARALEHPSGPETNRARCIQVEICDYAKWSQDWVEGAYKFLAQVALMIERRVPVPRRAPVSFWTPRRLTGQGFVRATGHLGHSHVPGNTHWDPGQFRIHKLFRLMGDLSTPR